MVALVVDHLLLMLPCSMTEVIWYEWRHTTLSRTDTNHSTRIYYITLHLFRPFKQNLDSPWKYIFLISSLVWVVGYYIKQNFMPKFEQFLSSHMRDVSIFFLCCLLTRWSGWDSAGKRWCLGTSVINLIKTNKLETLL